MGPQIYNQGYKTKCTNLFNIFNTQNHQKIILSCSQTHLKKKEQETRHLVVRPLTLPADQSLHTEFFDKYTRLSQTDYTSKFILNEVCQQASFDCKRNHCSSKTYSSQYVCQVFSLFIFHCQCLVNYGLRLSVCISFMNQISKKSEKKIYDTF